MSLFGSKVSCIRCDESNLILLFMRRITTLTEQPPLLATTVTLDLDPSLAAPQEVSRVTKRVILLLELLLELQLVNITPTLILLV